MDRVWMLLTIFLVAFPDQIWCHSDECHVPKGKDGEMGRAGRDGRPGQKGDRGDAGAPAHAQGLTSSKGDSGDPGISGEPGLLGYIGPEGPPGPLGDQGPKGLKGAMADTRGQQRPAFSAIQPKLKDNLLLFGEIITNEENVYNKDMGEFTCTVAGYYYFTFQVVSLGDLCLHIWMKRSRESGKKLLSFCDRNARNQHQVNSGGSVLNLNNGDQVWIETDAKSRKIAGKDVSSIFSGFLLFPRSE